MSESRYQFTSVTNNKVKYERGKEVEGHRTFNTMLLPDIPKNDEDIYIYTREGDRLDLLSYEYYGSAEYWWVLAQANNIKGSWVVEPGIRFRIPPSVDAIKEMIVSYNKGR
jgi:hypothetical protein